MYHCIIAQNIKKTTNLVNCDDVGVGVGIIGLCEHHAAHDDRCGYVEGTEESPCTHEHGADCYTEVASCTHIHTADCYPVLDSVSEDEATPSDAAKATGGTTPDEATLSNATEPECGHVCSVENGCITTELHCQHKHDDECGYAPATEGTPCGFVCEACTASEDENVVAFADDDATNTLPIVFKDGIHYLKTSDNEQEWLLLYCMNNKLWWPHHYETIFDETVKVPEYKEGYLTENDFEGGKENYETFLKQLSRLLYAGYPHNGASLYEIVSSESTYIPTTEEFNKILIPPSQLLGAFPELAHHIFTNAAKPEEIEEMRVFINSVFYMEGDEKINGLSKTDIEAMPFYKAANSCCMAVGTDYSPMEYFAHYYGGSYFVTKQQAYDATSLALWRLMNEWNIRDNDVEAVTTDELAKTLYLFAIDGKILRERPEADDLKLEGDLKFTWNPEDGKYHTGKLKLSEPEYYHGRYQLILPEGVTPLHDEKYVYGNQEVELVSNYPITTADSFQIITEIKWLEAIRQYSPSPDIEVTANGKTKKFQHMVGSVVHSATITREKTGVPQGEGSLSVSKTVNGGNDAGKEFLFTLTLPNNPLNGTYGDMTFTNGVAKLALKHGETKTATHLPEGAEYQVDEVSDGTFHSTSVNSSGKIQNGRTIAVTFTNHMNTPAPDLTIGTIVTGEQGDKTKPFTFVIELKDRNGNAVSETYNYTGGLVTTGSEWTVTPPTDNTLTFKDGKADIQLIHGQQITLEQLPSQGSYTITEREANADGYTTSYNKGKDSAAGILSESRTVLIENHKEAAPDSGQDKPGGTTPDKPDNPTPDKPDNPTPDKPDNPTPDKPDRPDTNKPNKPDTNKPGTSGANKPNEPTQDKPDQPDTPEPSEPERPAPDQTEPPAVETPNPTASGQESRSEYENLDPNVPQTGDRTGLSFWTAALLVSCAGLFLTLAAIKRKTDIKRK